MRKISLILLSMGALLALSLCWQGPASAQELNLVPPEGFGKKIAGSYLMSFRFPPDYPNPTTGQLTINVDGTYTAFPEAAFGRDCPAATRFRSAWHGTWERIGERTIKMRAYIYAHSGVYNHDDPDDPLSLLGETAWIARQNPVAEFDEEYECFTGDISTEIFLREQLFLPDPEEPEGGSSRFPTLPRTRHTACTRGRGSGREYTSPTTNPEGRGRRHAHRSLNLPPSRCREGSSLCSSGIPRESGSYLGKELRSLRSQIAVEPSASTATPTWTWPTWRPCWWCMARPVRKVRLPLPDALRPRARPVGCAGANGAQAMRHPAG